MKHVARAALLGVAALMAGTASAKGIEVVEGLPDLSVTSTKTWGPGPIPLAGTMPRFDEEVPATRGLGGADIAAWQKATVIVLVPGGFGSGALISGDGWVLTNYHVVEGPLQESATQGNRPVVVEIVTCDVTDKGARRRPGALLARVFRVDPQRDLALLKIDGKPPEGGWPHFTRHQGPVAVQSECFAVGSQGGGIPWAVRRGNVTVLGTYPYGFTEFVVGAVDSAQVAGLRQRIDMIITSCEISSGDSGGPLVNDEGELIGLTFATPVNLSTGAVGFHISGATIAAFLDPLPKEPEEAPFDLWMGGLAEASHGPPRLGRFKVADREIQALQLPVLQSRGGAVFPVASALYVDFQDHNHLASGEDPGPGLAVPSGLWGLTAEGGFRFDALVVCRMDSVTAVGYAGQDAAVDEIRIDTNRDGLMDHRWRRQASHWVLERSRGTLQLVDPGRLGESGAATITAILDGCRK